MHFQRNIKFGRKLLHGTLRDKGNNKQRLSIPYIFHKDGKSMAQCKEVSHPLYTIFQENKKKICIYRVIYLKRNHVFAQP